VERFVIGALPLVQMIAMSAARVGRADLIETFGIVRTVSQQLQLRSRSKPCRCNVPGRNQLVPRSRRQIHVEGPGKATTRGPIEERRV